MRRLFSILTLGVALTACATSQPSTRESRLAVEQASDQLIAARQQNDSSAFAARFTEDGIYMVPGVLDATGRTAVQDLAQKGFAGRTAKDYEVHRREIDVLGDAAYELAWFSETASRHQMKGRHFIHWKRGGDQVWRVHRYHYNFSDAVPLP